MGKWQDTFNAWWFKIIMKRRKKPSTEFSSSSWLKISLDSNVILTFLCTIYAICENANIHKQYEYNGLICLDSSVSSTTIKAKPEQ